MSHCQKQILSLWNSQNIGLDIWLIQYYPKAHWQLEYVQMRARNT